jgi:uncharacterized protein YkwD
VHLIHQRRRAAAWVLAVAVASLAALAAPGGANADDGCPGADVEPAPHGPSLEQSTLCLLNAERAAAGLRPVSLRPELSGAAADFSAEMVRRAFFAHRAPGGPSLAARLRGAGYLGRQATVWVVGENLAWARGSAATPRRLVAAWMASPGHRRNILEPAFRDVGIGVAPGTPGAAAEGVTVTTDFGIRVVRGVRRGGRSGGTREPGA